MINTQSGMTGEKLYLDLKHRVLRGDYAPGMKLPSVRILAQQNKVGTATVSRVLTQLQNDGVVNVHHGKGVFVTRTDPDKKKTATIVMLYFCRNETSFSPYSSPFGISCLQVCRRFCLDRDYTFIHRPMFPDAEHIEQTVNEFCADSSVCGFIVLYAGNDVFSEYAKILHDFSFKPVVFIDNPRHKKHEFNYVAGDDLQLGIIAARYLCELGHERISYIMWDTAKCFRDRLLGFETELIRQGGKLAEDMVFRVHNMKEEKEVLESLVKRIKENKKEITVVHCDKDRTALTFIEMCRSANISVPEDISVMGGTGSEISAHYTPALTACYVSSTYLAEEACNILMELVEDPDAEPVQRILEGTVVERESSCSIR